MESAKADQYAQQQYNKYIFNLVKGIFDTQRDENGMQSFHQLEKLGCFGKEYCVYGIAYEDMEGIAYRVSTKNMNLYDFVDESYLENIYPTSIYCLQERKMTPSGLGQQIMELEKKEVARKLQGAFNEQYFKGLKKIVDVAPNDSALDVLEKECDALYGVYSKDRLEAFEGLLVEAMKMKRLTLNTYYHFDSFIKDMKNQMEDDIQAKATYEKNLSGFSYLTANGSIKYCVNAFSPTTYSLREEHELNGALVSPVVRRKFWLQNMGDFAKVKTRFLESLKKMYGEAYWNNIKKIHSQVPVITLNEIVQDIEKIRTEGSDLAYKNYMKYVRRLSDLFDFIS